MMQILTGGRWYGHDGKFTAAERRILIAIWAAGAYKNFLKPEYDHVRKRSWEKIECLLYVSISFDKQEMCWIT